MFVNVTLSLVPLTAVAIKKQFVLNILSGFLWTLLNINQSACAFYIFVCDLSPSSVSCTLFKIGSVFEKIKHRIECVF
jgi:hypothetical protein